MQLQLPQQISQISGLNSLRLQLRFFCAEKSHDKIILPLETSALACHWGHIKKPKLSACADIHTFITPISRTMSEICCPSHENIYPTQFQGTCGWSYANSHDSHREWHSLTNCYVTFNTRHLVFCKLNNNDNAVNTTVSTIKTIFVFTQKTLHVLTHDNSKYLTTTPLTIYTWWWSL